jgi:hypothetical protein
MSAPIREVTGVSSSRDFHQGGGYDLTLAASSIGVGATRPYLLENPGISIETRVL